MKKAYMQTQRLSDTIPSSCHRSDATPSAHRRSTDPPHNATGNGLPHRSSTTSLAYLRIDATDAPSLSNRCSHKTPPTKCGGKAPAHDATHPSRHRGLWELSRRSNEIPPHTAFRPSRHKVYRRSDASPLSHRRSNDIPPHTALRPSRHSKTF